MLMFSEFLISMWTQGCSWWPVSCLPASWFWFWLLFLMQFSLSSLGYLCFQGRNSQRPLPTSCLVFFCSSRGVACYWRTMPTCEKTTDISGWDWPCLEETLRKAVGWSFISLCNTEVNGLAQVLLFTITLIVIQNTKNNKFSYLFTAPLKKVLL